MNIRSIIAKFVAQICEKNYSAADKTLDTVVTEKVKSRIKKTAEKLEKKEEVKKPMNNKKKVVKKPSNKNK
jgi:hypothetical protein